jgi:hypothetical protein
MIKLAGMYLSTEGINLLAKQFKETLGTDAFPVKMKSGNRDEEQVQIDAIQQKYGKKAVFVPEPLHDILVQSNEIESLASIWRYDVI